jgi:hypothetical protein
MLMIFLDITLDKQQEIDEIGLAVLGGESVFPYGLVYKKGQSWKTFENLLIGLHDSKSYPWASYGAVDMNILDYHLPRMGYKSPLGCIHVDAKNYYSVLFNTEDASLKSAMAKLLTPEERTPKFQSVAAEAAYQAAQVFAAMIQDVKKRPIKNHSELGFISMYGGK